MPQLTVLLAQGVGLPHPGDIGSWWNFNPLVVIPLEVALLVYGRGLLQLWSRAGLGHGVRVWQATAFVTGIVLLFLALASPLDALGEVLFSAHMAQHIALMVLIPPLLVMGAPTLVLLWGLPRRMRLWAGKVQRWRWLAAVWQLLAHPLVIMVLHALVLWVWHLPTLYEAALRNTIVHLLEHLSFFSVAFLYWWSLAHTRRARGVGVLSLFFTAIQGGLLGALMTFSGTPWYPIYAERAPLWGLTALQDQQLAGVIMWLPAGIVYLLGALVLLARLLGADDTRLTAPAVEPAGMRSSG